jgi:hypothetical protein
VEDRLKKYAHFVPISSHFKALHVENTNFKEIFILHGLPKRIVSDRDSRFMSYFWKYIFHLKSIYLTPNISYHPKTDGQTKIVNKWVEGCLQNYVSNQQYAWVKLLYLGEYCYDTTHHMSISMNPFRSF